MGVKDLWDVLQPAGTSRSFKQLVVSEGFETNVSRRRAFRIGIDCSLWFQHVKMARGTDQGENGLIRGLFFKVVALSKLPVIPIFVFDGRNRPKIKRGSKLGKSGTHPLNKPMIEILNAFGMEWRMAEGEAEAELAFLNYTGVVDAVLTDDADAFVFGAQTVIRNTSLGLGGNKSNPALDRNGNKSSHHCMVYRAEDFESNPKVKLSRGGLILYALFSGGDYDQGIFGAGRVISHAMARSDSEFGDSLLSAYKNRHEENFDEFLKGWRFKVDQEFRSYARRYLSPATHNMCLPPDFPKLDILQYYADPMISQSAGRSGGGPVRDTENLNLASIAALCEKYFEWGTRTLIIKRFRSLGVWDAAIIALLRRATIEQDERAVDRHQSMEYENLAMGGETRTSSQNFTTFDESAVRRYLDKTSDEYLARAFANRGPQFNTCKTPILKIAGKAKPHVSTDYMAEYNVHVHPEEFVRLALAGIKGTRPEPVTNTSMGDDNNESEDDQAPTQSAGTKRKPKRDPPGPFDIHTMKCPKSILLCSGIGLVETFERQEEESKQRREDAEVAKDEKRRERDRKMLEKAAAKEERQREEERRKREKTLKALTTAKQERRGKRKSMHLDSDADSDASPTQSFVCDLPSKKIKNKSSYSRIADAIPQGSSISPAGGASLASFPFSGETFSDCRSSSSAHRQLDITQSSLNQDATHYSVQDKGIDSRGIFLFTLPESDNPDDVQREDLNELYRKDLLSHRWSGVGPSTKMDDLDEDVDMLSRDDILDEQMQASFFKKAHSAQPHRRIKNDPPMKSESHLGKTASLTSINSTSQTTRTSRLVRITPISRKTPGTASAVAPLPIIDAPSKSSCEPSASHVNAVVQKPKRLSRLPLFSDHPTSPSTPQASFQDAISAANLHASLFLASSTPSPSPSPIIQRTRRMERHSSVTSFQSTPAKSDYFDPESDEEEVSWLEPTKPAPVIHSTAAHLQRLYAARKQRTNTVQVIDLCD